ncbi:MAG: hypothetical protein G01um10147_390 [Microgenomates group bacterium Gr01-1014_7]|nr:MAG: hypothetical protein G01um10147_390 [Microgenomates group bacterium Gr01-1014_7]
MLISNILNSYINKWVALTSDRKKVVAAAPDLKKLDIKVKKAKMGDVIYHYVLPFDKSFSP